MEAECSNKRPNIQLFNTQSLSLEIENWLAFGIVYNESIATFSSWKVLTADVRVAGANFTPSMKIATGVNKKKDITVIIEKSVMLSIDSCTKQTSGYANCDLKKQQPQINEKRKQD